MAKKILSKTEFIKIFKEELAKNKNLTYAELVEIINKNYTTADGRAFTTTILSDRARSYELSGSLKAKNVPLKVKDIKALSSKENIKLYNKGDIDLDTFRRRAVSKKSDANRSPEQKAKRSKAERERRLRDLKTEEGRSRIKANRVRAKAKEYKLKGMDPPANTATEALWKDIVKTAKENKGNGRFTLTGFKNSMDRADFFSNKITIKDKITGKTFTFGKDITSKGDSLKNFINTNAKSFDVVNFQEVIKPYQQKYFINSIDGLRNSINKQLIPGYNAGQTQNAFTVQHNLGRQKNPLKVSLAFLNDNTKEFRVKSAFEKIWNNAKDPKTGTIKVTPAVKDAFKEYTKGISEIDTVSQPVGATRANRTFGQSLSLAEMLKKTKGEGTKLPRGLLKKAGEFESLLLDYAKTNKGNVCQLFLNKGGRTGFANGGSGCAGQMADALDSNSEDVAKQVSKIKEGGVLSKVKNSANAFLTAVKAPGSFRGKVALGAGAVIGGFGGGALVKQFRNDDPSTYLNNEGQMEGMLISDVEEAASKVEDNPILNNQFKLEALAAAGITAPIAKGVYNTQRFGTPQLLETPMELDQEMKTLKKTIRQITHPGGKKAKRIGAAAQETIRMARQRMAELNKYIVETTDPLISSGKGPIRSALGLSGVLGKGLWALTSPIVALPSTAMYIAKDKMEGKSTTDALTNPLTYLAPAFMNQSVKALAKAGASRGLLAIAGAGLAGTAALPALSIASGIAAAGSLGYQAYKKFFDKTTDEDFFNR